MLRTTTAVFRAPSRRHLPRLLAGIGAWLFTLPLSASSPCDHAVALPLDRGISSPVAAGSEPSIYALEIGRPGLLIVEARGEEPLSGTPGIRLLGPACRPLGEGLGLAPYPGRRVHRIPREGIYHVEVLGSAPGERVRLNAWQAQEPPLEPLRPSLASAGSAGGGDQEPPREPIDEWDESTAGDDATNPSQTRRRDPPGESRWQEIAGLGVLEVVPSSRGAVLRFHSWCPWLQRPGLLRTFTCARPLSLQPGAAVRIEPLLAGGPELVALTLSAGGRLRARRSDGEAASLLLFDAFGRSLDRASADAGVALGPGRYFLEVGDDLRLELDAAH